MRYEATLAAIYQYLLAWQQDGRTLRALRVHALEPVLRVVIQCILLRRK